MDRCTVGFRTDEATIFWPEKRVCGPKTECKTTPEIEQPQPVQSLNYIQINKFIDEIEDLPSMDAEKIKHRFLRPMLAPLVMSEGEMMTLCLNPGDLAVITEMLGNCIAGIRLESNVTKREEKIAALEWMLAHMREEYSVGLQQNREFIRVWDRYSDRYQMTIAEAFPTACRIQDFIGYAMTKVGKGNSCVLLYRAFTYLEILKSIPKCQREKVDLKNFEQIIAVASQLYAEFGAEEARVYIQLTTANSSLERINVKVIANVLSKLIVRSLCDTYMDGSLRDKYSKDVIEIWGRLMKHPHMMMAVAGNQQLVELHISRHARSAYVSDPENPRDEDSLQPLRRKCLGKRVTFIYDSQPVQGVLKAVFGPENRATIVVTNQENQEHVYLFSNLSEFKV